ncbi:MAG: GntR family transcriptional regulator [Firmicutes bacterium]|nr:GntR family transcriptional regulator [Bacillota bacterium]
MKLNLTVDEEKAIPLYRQIGEGILQEIYTGRLAAGFQLPTVRELADEMGMSRGTIRHAYEYLVQIGAIEMIQGSGSFVLGVEEKTSSRKEKALEALDQMFSVLSGLGFTPREMEIYFQLKLKGLEETYQFVKAAVVDCNPETIRLIEKQLSQIDYLETVGFPLEKIGNMGRQLKEEYDLVLTTSTHFVQVESVIGDTRRMAMMAMRPTRETTISLARMGEEEQVGIVCASKNFAEIIRSGCKDMGRWSYGIEAYLFGEAQGLSGFLSGLTVVIAPAGYETFASEQEQSALHDFQEAGGRLAIYDYAIDKGSFIYVKELIRRCINKKKSL